MQKPDERQAVPSELYDESYFRAACEGYDEFNASEGEQLSRRLSSAFALATVEPGMTILDIGCGRGEILRHAAARGADAFGIDYAAVAVNMSRRVIEGIDGATPGKTAVAQADAKHLPYADHSFDRVLMFDVVEHLYPGNWMSRSRKSRGFLSQMAGLSSIPRRISGMIGMRIRSCASSEPRWGRVSITRRTRAIFWWKSMSMCM